MHCFVYTYFTRPVGHCKHHLQGEVKQFETIFSAHHILHKSPQGNEQKENSRKGQKLGIFSSKCQRGLHYTRSYPTHSYKNLRRHMIEMDGQGRTTQELVDQHFLLSMTGKCSLFSASCQFANISPKGGYESSKGYQYMLCGL